MSYKLLLLVLIVISKSDARLPDNPDFKKDLKPMPPCQTCKLLVKSFNNGMERTSRNKHDGGDSAWEESRLGSYANSEIRLVEIEEKLCTDIDEGKSQCHHILEDNESLIEEWWKTKAVDLFQFLCIDNLKVCCHEHHYGPECKPCKGEPSNTCSGHGVCKGEGTRKGSGECKCDLEYTGDNCEQCKTGFYTETLPDSTEKCSKCDLSCKGHCRKGGPMGCEICAEGYQYITDYGCVDIDECIESKSPVCSGNTFCANTIATFHCLDCDKSCDGCTGDGPDMCNKCAQGFVQSEGLCVEEGPLFKSLHSDLTRYGTYFGLCLSTLIIFRKNIYIASLIGLSVALYISLSEYTLGDWNKRELIRYMKSWLTV